MPFANPFGPELFAFVRDLTQHNDRDWFQRHKSRYELDVKEPAFAFISGFGPHLREISPHFLAIPKAQGGSLFRIHRDTRFSADKRPYKTHVGIHFRHAAGSDAHTPGFYLHLQPGGSFVGVGLWRPDSPTLRQIRDAMVARPAEWTRARDAFAARFELGGERLKRPPRDFAPDHPLIEDLKRKDFIGTVALGDDEVLAGGFPGRFAAACRDGAPLVKWLCAAVEVPF